MRQKLNYQATITIIRFGAYKPENTLPTMKHGGTSSVCIVAYAVTDRQQQLIQKIQLI